MCFQREHFCGVMDHKAWLWKKKSAEKTIANDRVDLPLQGNDEQQVIVVLLEIVRVQTTIH